MAKIHIDQGHGYPGSARGGVLGLDEGENNFYLGKEIGEALSEMGHSVTYSRNQIRDMSPDADKWIPVRRDLGKGKDLFLSVHSNAGGGTGVEIFDRVTGARSPALSKSLAEVISLSLGIRNRGVKEKRQSDGRDYFGVLRNNPAKSAMLVEFFFHDNAKDVSAYRKNKDKMIKELAKVIHAQFGGVELAMPIKATPILSASTTTVKGMEDWAKSKNANRLFVQLAQIFYDIAVKKGIDPAVLYAQSAKETGYMKFGGVLDASYYNPCGLKTTVGGGDKDKEAHTRFPDWVTGITAQADHLALYAGHKDFPMKNTPDPRHFAYLHGTAKTVEELGGKWAPAKNYGEDIVKMMEELYTYKRGETLEDAKLKGVNIIAYMPDALQTAMELSRIISVPLLNAKIPHNYEGKYSSIICVGGVVDNFTRYMTHWLDLKDNHSADRIRNMLQEFTKSPEKYRKVR